MRNRVWLLHSPRIHFSLLVGALTSIALISPGCGGGGGGGGGGNNGGGGCVGRTVTPGNPSLATITGKVFDTSGAAVDGAPVTIVVAGGTNIATTTDCTGTFTVTNVPLTATTFIVRSPNVITYYNYANYDGNLYDLINCTLPLPKLTAGQNAPFTTVQIYLGGPNPPPPPPANGCPA